MKNMSSHRAFVQLIRQLFVATSFALTLPLFAADTPPIPVAKSMVETLKIIEHDLVPLAQEMPANLYDFAPTAGEFKGVKTFGQMLVHVATNIYGAAAIVLGEKPPVDLGDGNNGPTNLKTKDEIFSYLKGSIAYAHKAMESLTAANIGDELDPGWGKHSRLFMANVIVWHSFDHYGQLVEYVRMNGIIPPASRPRK